MPEANAPDLKNKSFSISAKAKIGDKANGMILTQGGNTGGWGFYILDGQLTLAHNFLDLEVYTVRSDKPIPAGEHDLSVTFKYEGGKDVGKGGSVTLQVDGKKVGSGKIDRTTPMKYSLSENQDIGTDTGTPITYEYQTPFDFEGELHEVTVELS